MTTSGRNSLVGREHALHELAAVIAEARAQERPAVVRVHGLPGAGKTAFLRTALSIHASGKVAAAAAQPSDVARAGSCARRLLADAGAEGGPEDLDRLVAGLDAICVDDLQWVDEPTARALGSAIRSSKIALLALFADRREDAPELVPHRTIRLDPLTELDAMRLVKRRYPAAPAELAADIVRASGGSPFNLTVLASEAARRKARLRDQLSPSVRAVIADRLMRAEPGARDAVRLCSLVESDADVQAIARACSATVDATARSLASFADIVELRDLTAGFRHALLREAVAETVDDRLAMYRRLLSAYLGEERALNRDAVVLRCAIACGDDSTTVTYASAIERRAVASGAAATALRYSEIVLRHAPVPTPVNEAVEHATILQHLGRDLQAASFLQRELREAIDRGDGRRAAELVIPFASLALTLERQAELHHMCERIAAMPTFDASSARLLRTARLLVLAFSGDLDEYRQLADVDASSPADLRIGAFAAALSGDAAAARMLFQQYQADLRVGDARQEPVDRVLQAVIAFCSAGNSAFASLDASGPIGANGTYRGADHFRLAARIHDGRWDEARAIIERLPLWDSSYEEPFPILDARLELDALAGRSPAERHRTVRTIRAMIARGQVRHAASPARWYVLAARGSGLPLDADLEAFAGETLPIGPPAYLMTGTPAAVALLEPHFGRSRCLAALERWPRFGSRWHQAQDAFARALLRGDHEHLREVRTELERLNCPVFAAIAGLALPVPRTADVELARDLGIFGRDIPAPPSLTPRESDVAELAAQDLRNREIAARLGISERTVEVHLSSAFRKLGVRSRGGLARRLAKRRR